MVVVPIKKSTTDELMKFARETYPEHFIKPTTKHKKSLYFRRTVMHLLWSNGEKVGVIANNLGESHANVSIALPKVRAYFTTDGSDLFFECYNEFVKEYNKQKQENEIHSGNGN